MSVPPKVCAVVVTYHPGAERFASILAALASQVASIVVVDNGGAARELATLCGGAAPANCVFLPQRENIGVAAGQNVGIRWAIAAQADYVLLLDHDSVPSAGMVEALLRAGRDLAAQGKSVGALGPVTVDARTGRAAPFVRFGALGTQRLGCPDSGEPAIAADFLIASGSLIAAGVLAAVGTMDESFFIDHVDTDWCLRARAAGYSLFGVCGAKLSHRLGDKVIQIGFPVRRSIYVHSPERIYYSVRNSLLLYCRPHAELKWILTDSTRLLLLIAFYCLVAGKRGAYVGAVLRAMRDAYARLARRSGN